MKTICGLIVVLCMGLAASAAVAQNYPDKPMRILVGFPPGGPPDVAARILADRFSQTWGQPVVVENVTGSGGNLAIERAAKAPPDGYTLVMASNAIVINPSLYDNLPYDAAKDLTPISLAVSMPCILVVNNDLPARNVKELIALARAQPGKLTYGHAGVGTPAHLAGELFKIRAAVDVQPIPYRGMPPTVPDLLAGRISMIFPNVSVVLNLVREEKARALAITSLKRFAPMPDLPTMDESGFPGFEATAWFGLMAPSRTPPAAIVRLHRETVRALAVPEIRTRLGGLGMEVVANSPTEFLSLIRNETQQWAKLIKEAGIKASE